MIRHEFRNWTFRSLRHCALSAVALLACATAQAQIQAQDQARDSVAAFYKGRTISLTIAYPPGGSYDIYARLAAAHMGKYIPGQPH